MKRPFLNLLLLLTVAGSRSVHAQSILITEPVEWREGRSIVVVRGKSVRVAGTATHPGGISKVLINGREVAIRQDKDFPDYFEFERVFAADSVTAEVTIRLMPVSGQPFEKRYPATLPTGPIVVAGGGVKPPPPPPPKVNAWGAFKRRGILYGAAVIGGGVMATMSKTESAVVCFAVGAGQDCVDRKTTSKPYGAAGGALVGGAVLVTIVDAMLTSRRANKSVASIAIPGGVRLSLEAPTLSPSVHGTAVNVLTIGVR